MTNGTRQWCTLSPLVFSLAIEPLAESIRTNPNITGIKIGKYEHKIGLFADDVIISVTNPEASLPTVQNVLELFGNVSYYKINPNKCHVLPMNLNTDITDNLHRKYDFNWEENSLSYLGIKLAYPSSKIYGANFPALVDIVHKDLQKFQKTQVLWVGKIAVFKMVTLPKILYYVRTLPILIPTKFVTQINTKLKNIYGMGKKLEWLFPY